MNDSLAARIPGIYERWAAEWDADRLRAGWNDRPWHERFVSLLKPGDHVLDLGCGSGRPVARHLVQKGFFVTGVDTSPAMIAMCHARMPTQEWFVCDMRRLALDRRFQGLLGWDSFFFLPPDDQRAMFAVFARHAAPGAWLMFNTGPRHSVAIGTYRGEPLYHASLDEADYRALLDAHDFDVAAHVVEDPEAGGRTVWLARARASRRPSPAP